jgi:hypothetical protein
VCRAAAASGSFAALCWAHLHGCPWNGHATLNAAASSGSIELTAWVQQQLGVTFSGAALEAAARQGHTAVCVYLLQQQQQQHLLLDESACLGAIKGGHVDTLRCLREHGCPWNAEVVRRNVAQKGSIAMMEYLQQQGLLATAAQLTAMLNIAAANNRLAAAQWLRQQGAQWPHRLKYNIKYWRGDTLVWARQQGCTAPTLLLA